MRKHLAIAVGLLTLVAVGFQNCGTVDFQMMSQLEGLGGPQIYINGGARITNSTGVTVAIASDGTTKMYITDDSTCNSGGDWEDQTSTRPFNLKQENQEARVYGKFKTARGEETICVEASILHDGLSPTIQILSGPESITSEVKGDFEFDAQDALSGIEKIECRVGSEPFQDCAKLHMTSPLQDANHVLQVRAVDKAGNKSAEVPYQWMIDTAAPTVQLTQTPQSLSNSTTAVFEFVGQDTGSGIKRFVCQMGAAAAQECSSPLNLQNLAATTHSFSVMAVDKAGNSSTPATFTFDIDNVPPGSFSITGVTSPATDVKIDSWLRGTVPTVYWTASLGAVNYSVSILNAGSQTVCAAQMTALTIHKLNGCVLSDLTRYKARVVATDQVGNTTTDMFDFVVDMSAPVIQATGPVPSADPKTATFNFTVADLAPGELASVTCSKTYAGATITQACDGLTTLTYNNLPFGDHVFRIVARDRAENESTREIAWKAAPVVCDPFDMTAPSAECKGGLVGDLFYLDGPLRNGFTNTVQYFYDRGIQVNVVLNLNRLFVPTRHFDQGFPTADGNTIKDNNGNTLFEYFAMRLKSQVRLDTTNPDVSKRDAPGYYEFALISDDGAKLKMSEGVGMPLQTLISNDGDHSTKMGCSSGTVYLDGTSTKPIQIEYYQGPRHEIAVTLMWRKVPTQAVSNDSLCGVFGGGTFFGPFPYTNMTNAYGYGQLVDRGWKVMSQYNFLAP